MSGGQVGNEELGPNEGRRFVLLEGNDEKGELKMGVKSTWDDFTKAASEKLGFEVSTIVYDDEFGPVQKQNTVCTNQKEWENVLMMIEADSSKLKNKFCIKVTRDTGHQDKISNTGVVGSGSAAESGIPDVKALAVTLVSVRHLPKTDAFGRCDPYVSVTLNGLEHKTKVAKNVFDATYDETFEFELNDKLIQSPGELVVRVYDWNQVSKDELVGEHRLDEARVINIIRGAVGSAGEEDVAVMMNGTTVRGKDKQNCSVRVKFIVLDRRKTALSSSTSKTKKNVLVEQKSSKSIKNLVVSGTEESHVDVDEKAQGLRHVNVSLLGARHLPQKDSVLFGGKTDAYCVLEFRGQEFKSEVQKNTLSPDWNETYQLQNLHASGEGVGSDVTIRIYDWNRLTSNELIGEVIISRQRMRDVVRAKSDWEGKDIHLIQRDGKVLAGTNGQQSVLLVSLSVTVPPACFEGLVVDESAAPQLDDPRRIQLTIVGARHLPKTDLMGKCDAFVEVIVEGVSHKTEVVKNSYEPQFQETFSFDMADAFTSITRDVVLRLYDWNLTSASEVVGECAIPFHRMAQVKRFPNLLLTLRICPLRAVAVVLKARIGWEGMHTFQLSLEGKAVLGHDKMQTELDVSIKILEAPKAFPDAAPEVGANGARRLELTVLSARSLPKMDSLLGKCDGYVVVTWDEVQYITKTIKNSYTPEWNETFFIDFADVSRVLNQDLTVRVMDWDAVGENDEVGHFQIPAQRVSDVVRSKIGWSSKAAFHLLREGQPVMGHDKDKSEVRLQVKVAKVPDAFEGLDPEEGVKGARRLEVTLVCARSLPKMDALLSKCDGYAVLEFEGVECRTQTVKSSYDPEWNETFVVDIADVGEPLEKGLNVRVMDWDAGSNDDQVGTLVVPSSRMHAVLSSKIGSEGTHVFRLMQDGKPVVGHDKRQSEVHIKVKIAEVPVAFPTLVAEAGAKGARRLEVTVVSGKSMPKMDALLGKCDAFVMWTFDQVEYRTAPQKGTYNPQWGEAFTMDVVDVAEDLAQDVTFRVMDWDRTSKNEEVGTFVVPRKRMTELLRGLKGVACTDTFQLTLNGRPVIGHDKQRSEVTLRVLLTDVPLAFPELVPDDKVVEGPRRLEVTVVGARSLPKMDGLLGKCDPYVVLLFEGVEFRTSTVKRTYDPMWSEVFCCDVADAARGVLSNVTVTVMDWDAGSKDDEVGACSFSSQRISDMLRAPIGAHSSGTFTIRQAGKPVVGHDGRVAQVDLRVRVLEVPVAFPTLVAEAGAKGARRLEVTVVSGKSMPKMDALLGKCDPYAKLVFEGVEYRTRTVKRTYSPEWNDIFNIDFADARQHITADVVCQVFDWDAGTADDEIGSFNIPAGRLMQLLQSKVGSEGSDAFALSLEGRPVMGIDKGRTSVTLKVRVLEVPDAFPNMVPEVGVSCARRMELTLVGAKSLPKMDSFLGSCDPYALIFLEQHEFRTKTIKGTYTPEWSETFYFDFDDVLLGCKSDLVVKVMDWDASSKDDEVGAFKIPAKRVSEVMRAALGSESAQAFPLSLGGKPVVGYDKGCSEVHVRIRVVEVPVIFPEVCEEEEGASGARHLEVTVVSARSLPKMDSLLGSCDPYCLVMFKGVELRTEVKKRTYTPTWNEALFYDVVDVSQPCSSDLRFCLMDWDATNEDDEIGSCCVPARRVREVLRARVGAEGTHNFMLSLGGKPVVGNDGNRSELSIRVRVLEVPVAFPTLVAEAGAKGARRLEVTVVSGKSMPKMDALLGKCDPYAKLVFDGVECRTETVKREYNPKWNETFVFDVPDVAGVAVAQELRVTVMDWDAASKDDEIGTATIPALRMTDLCRAPLLSEARQSFLLMHENVPVIGQDKSRAEVELAIRIVHVPLAFPSILPETNCTGPKRVELSIVRGNSLPKMDALLGKCDPYVQFSWEGMLCRTKTMMRTYTPVWEEVFVFDQSDVSKPFEHDLHFRVLDWDAATVDDQIGHFSIFAARVAELTRAAVGSEGTHTFQLLEKGKTVTGHDNAATEVTLKLRLLDLPVAFPELVPEEGAMGSRRLEITVISGKSMPKMDALMGSCDPYCTLVFEGAENKTQVIRGSQTPAWNEVFVFEVLDAAQGCHSDLAVQVRDWDMTSGDDEIGRFKIPAHRMSELVKAPIGSFAVGTFDLFLCGKHVLGRDGSPAQPAQVDLQLRVLCDGTPKADMTSYRLHVAVVGADHLPKADTFGSCDGYCVLQLGRRKVQTKVVKNSYCPTFGEVFSFALENETRLKVSMYDWDKLTEHDLLGDAFVPLDLHPDTDQEGAEEAHVLSLKSGPVFGRDKARSQVRLRLTYSLRSDDVVLLVKVRGAVNLPKADATGACDAYVVLELGDQKHTTVVVYNSYTAKWDETFGFDIINPRRNFGQAAEDLHFILKDKDKFTKDDTLGFASISAEDIKDFLLQKPLGNSKELRIKVKDSPNGAEVRGHNGKYTEIFVQLRWGEGDKAEAETVLELQVLSGDHLPKLDGPLDACDPYVVVHLADQRCKTKVVKRCMRPEWNQTFAFDLEDPAKYNEAHGCGPATLTLMDFDRLSADDTAGWVEIAEADIIRALSHGVGYTQDLALKLWDAKAPKDSLPKNRRYAVGDDGKITTIHVRIHVSRAPVRTLEKVICIHGNDPGACETCAKIREAEAWLKINAAPVVLRHKRVARRSDRKLGPELVERFEWSPEGVPEGRQLALLSLMPGEEREKERGPNWLEYVDAPVWRGRNGEVLVGRDLVPFVGMRVLLSRQTRRFLYEQGREDPSNGGAGTVVKIQAGVQSVVPAEYTHEYNGAFCKVAWDDTKKRSKHPVGANAQFALVPYEKGMPYKSPKIREVVIEAAVKSNKPDPLRGPL